MTSVHLRPVTKDSFDECVSLNVAPNQVNLVASNMKSLAEAAVNPNYYPLAIYDAAVRGHELPNGPMVGFVMYEITAGVGFIMRMMIDERYQRRGYGRAALLEVIRRLKLYPEVELITVSYLRQNIAAARLYESAGFVPWEVEWAQNHPTDIYVKLSE